jgi:UDP-N-acetylmuramoyl-tripeptide--D-alanyl-D-alanine ligase
MTSPLWTAFDIAAAVDGEVYGDFRTDGVTFDSREVGPGDLFIALKGETTDGHRFLDKAFAAGAAGAIVSDACDGPHVRVADTMTALDALGAAARDRMHGRVIGVTGSVGKTGTKEALYACLDRALPGRVHRSVKSYNNHTGVPLSLARMPADTRIGVFEMGMNHSGELAALTRLVRPHVAIVTAIAPAHSAFFASEADIADAKGEIFQGLQPGGVAIIPYDSPHRDRLIAAAKPHAARILTFGMDRAADVHAQDVIPLDRGTLLSLVLPDAELTFTIAPPGEHWVSNAMAVIAAVWAVGGDLAAAGLAFAEMEVLPGRGQRSTIAVGSGAVGSGEALLIDESYNANPASMAATIKMLGRERADRRIAVLGEMRELGAGSAGYHADLAGPLRDAGVDFALLVGSEMAALANALEGRIEFEHVPDADAAIESIEAKIAPGDAILIKGSNAIGLSRLVAHLRTKAVAGERTTCST